MSFGTWRLGYLAMLVGGCSLFDFTSPSSSNPGSAVAGAANAGAPNDIGTSGAGSSATGGTSSGGDADGGAGEPVSLAGSAGRGGSVNSGGAAGSSSTGGGSPAGQGGDPIGPDCEHPGSFPATGLLDDFERTGPAWGSNWSFETGDAGDAVLTLNQGFVTIANASVGNVAQWVKPAGGFGNAQEVWATVSNIDPDGGGVALWLKEKVLAVGYYSDGHQLFIAYRGNVFDTFATRADINLAARQKPRLGGRAFENGCVQMFLDGELVLHALLTDLKPPPAPATYENGGRIGLAAEGLVHFEDFGGGSL